MQMFSLRCGQADVRLIREIAHTSLKLEAPIQMQSDKVVWFVTRHKMLQVVGVTRKRIEHMRWPVRRDVGIDHRQLETVGVYSEDLLRALEGKQTATITMDDGIFSVDGVQLEVYAQGKQTPGIQAIEASPCDMYMGNYDVAVSSDELTQLSLVRDSVVNAPEDVSPAPFRSLDLEGLTDNVEALEATLVSSSYSSSKTPPRKFLYTRGMKYGTTWRCSVMSA